MKKRTLFAEAQEPRLPLSASTRRAKLGLCRFQVDGGEEGLLVSVPQQDAFMVIFQLRDHPAHEHWVEGRPAPAPPSPRGCLQIVDLNTSRSALLKGRTDSLHFHIPRAALDDLAEAEGGVAASGLRVPSEWTTADRQLQQLQPLLLDMLDSQKPSRMFTDHVVLAAAAHVAVAYGEMRLPAVKGSGALAPWQVKRAREMIAANLAKEVTLSDVALACGLSPAYFARAFKAATQATPHDWLQTCRINKARQLMLDPSTSLAEIAVACGFADQSHLTRIFKRYTGLGPGAWRRMRLS